MVETSMSAIHLQTDLLVDICHDLDSEDLDKLKFLMKDVAGLAKLKPATIALDLFTAVQNNKNVALYNGRFLAECFELMGRSDLVRTLGFDPLTVSNELGQTQYSINPFRILLYRISEDLSDEDVTKLTFYCERVFKLSRKEKENVTSPFDLFVLLEKRGEISVGSTKRLRDMVRTLENRSDLDDLVSEYQVTYPETTGTIPMYDEQDTSNQRIEPSAHQGAHRTRQIELAVPFYVMTANPRGICVIINNNNFTRMKSREGTDIDEAKLKRTFKRLGFLIAPYKNKTVKDMAGIMKDISLMDHSKYNALVVCILSHGGENFIYRMDGNTTGPRRSVRDENDREVQGNFVYGVDDKPIPIRYLTMYFRSSTCKTLANKPKLFFIQACQGDDMETGVLMPSDLERDGPSIDDTMETDVDVVPSDNAETDSTPHASDNRKVIPDESDFLMGYATVFGYVSYRSRSEGSFYISRLTENLDNYADTLDLQQIMTKVNHDVAEENIKMGTGKAKKQIPMTQTTLRKQLYLSPDNLK